MRVDVLWTAPFKVHKSDNHSLIQKAYKGKKLLIRVWYYFGVLGPFGCQIHAMTDARKEWRYWDTASRLHPQHIAS
jgi:hypothetical protein